MLNDGPQKGSSSLKNDSRRTWNIRVEDWQLNHYNVIRASFGSRACQLKSLICFQGKQLGQMLDEDPALMERRQQCAKRLDLYKAARDEIESVSWARWKIGDTSCLMHRGLLRLLLGCNLLLLVFFLHWCNVALPREYVSFTLHSWCMVLTRCCCKCHLLCM